MEVLTSLGYRKKIKNLQSKQASDAESKAFRRQPGESSQQALWTQCSEAAGSELCTDTRVNGHTRPYVHTLKREIVMYDTLLMLISFSLRVCAMLNQIQLLLRGLGSETAPFWGVLTGLHLIPCTPCSQKCMTEE